MQLIGYPDLLGFTQRSRTTSALKARMDVVLTRVRVLQPFQRPVLI